LLLLRLKLGTDTWSCHLHLVLQYLPLMLIPNILSNHFN
jgi:hypothetical protein